jgi:hypothetical protein
MNKETFKAGDEVYCPSQGVKIHLLCDYESETYPLLLMSSNCAASISTKGFKVITDKIPYIFHATPENKALLEALYKCEFEAPKLKGSDLTRKLLSEGKHVLCYVSNSGDEAASTSGNSQVIIDCSTHSLGEWQFESSVDFWLYAVPCNDYANLPDGVLTLKSEQ